MSPFVEEAGVPGGDREDGSVPRPGQAGAFLVVLAFLFLTGAAFVTVVVGPETGILVSQWLFLLLPVLVYARLRDFDARKTFLLRTPDGREVLAGLLIIAGGTPLAWFLAWLQSFVIPVPTELLEQMQELLTADTPGELVWLLFLVALTPAICEEFVFRGFFLSATARRMSAWAAVLLNGFVFGVFHLALFRFLPTAWLGFLLAAVVWRTRSIWTGVLMHLVNNGSIVILSAIPALRIYTEGLEEEPPLVVLPLALLILFIGVRLLVGGPRRGEHA